MTDNKNRKLLILDDLSQLSPWGNQDKSLNFQELHKEKAKGIVHQHKKYEKPKFKSKSKGKSLKVIKGTNSVEKIITDYRNNKNLLKTVEYQLPPLSKQREKVDKQKYYNSGLTLDQSLIGISSSKVVKQKSHKKLEHYNISTLIAQKQMSKFRLKGKKFEPSQRTITNRWLEREQFSNMYQHSGNKKHIPANTLMMNRTKDDIMKKVLGQLHGKFS